jgi:hypothetical protein
MRSIILISFAFAAVLTACNTNSKTNTTASDTAKTTGITDKSAVTVNNDSLSNSPIKDALSAYMQIKDALANDNGLDAASAGNAFVAAIDKVDHSAMSETQKKMFDDIADDAKEMAEHIAKNPGKIEHQREHFEMLSNDIYDMSKAFKTGQPLYKVYCPMYNNNKGANWISESKEIRNPYLGKKMISCGEVKEEIR